MELTLFIVGTLLAVIGVLGLRILDKLEHTIAEAVKSVGELNQKVAKVIAAVEYHDERIKRLEDLKDDV
jgi:hypothetical protein